MKCESCLYNKNCQYLAKHPHHVVEDCTAYKDVTNFVEVVRCKNCRHWKCIRDDRGLCKHPTFTLDDDTIDPITEPKAFCSYGEKKGDAE